MKSESINLVIAGFGKNTGLQVDNADIAAIRRSLNLGFTVSELVEASRKAVTFYYINGCRFSRATGDRLKAEYIYKDAQTVRGFLGYESKKNNKPDSSMSSLRERIREKNSRATCLLSGAPKAAPREN